MDTVLWILTALLAAAFLAAGAFKLSIGKAVESKGMTWAKHFSDGTIRLIGAAEVLGAVGIVLPVALGVAAWLTPVAAACLAALMAGAALQHLKDGDGLKGAAPAAVLGVLALALAAGRLLLG